MKKILLAARILTWFNLILWGGMLSLLLLFGLSTGFAPMIIAAFLFSAIPLHSYASLKLQKSIRFPQVKLNNQTPVGVRFIGFVALFFGILTIANGYVYLSDPKTSMESMKAAMPTTKGLTQAGIAASIQTAGVLVIVMGLAVIANVLLNIRLLRWYYLVKQSDVS